MAKSKKKTADWTPGRAYKVGDVIEIVGRDGKRKRAKITSIGKSKPVSEYTPGEIRALQRAAKALRPKTS